MLAVLSALSPETIDTLFAFAFGFTVAGLCASGYRLFSPGCRAWGYLLNDFRMMPIACCPRKSRGQQLDNKCREMLIASEMFCGTTIWS